MKTMKLLVLSDTHGRSDRVKKLLETHGDADTVCFLGDGIRDISREDCRRQGQALVCVQGNCDLFFGGEKEYSSELLLNLGEYTVMMMHGHLHWVKSGLDRAIRHAAEKGANVLLYGHTHIAEERYLPEGSTIGGRVLERPMWIMNPGSLGESGSGNPSYGLVQIRNGQILLSHGTVE